MSNSPITQDGKLVGAVSHILVNDSMCNQTTECLVVIGLSFLFEVVQFIFAIGASDITDLIGNILGGIVGILFGIMMKKIAPEKFVSVVNVSGLLIEIIAIGLMVLLLGANS